MKTAATKAGKIISAVTITILVAGAILHGVTALLMTCSKESDTSQGETRLQELQIEQVEKEIINPKSPAGSSEDVLASRVTYNTSSAVRWGVMQLVREETEPQKTQGWREEWNATDYLSGWEEINDMKGKYGFTLIHITDTQHLSKYNLWGTFTSWLVSIKNELNIKTIIHTGDIVEHWYNTTEWERADASMRILADAGVPYVWCIGNHDFDLKDDNYIGSEYLSFNSSTFEPENCWLSSFDQQSTAMNWTYEGYKFIVINLAWHCNETALTWLTNILDTNTDSNIIVATHSYINSTGGYGWYGTGFSWEENLRTILDDYPNVFLTLSAHDISGTGYHSNVNERAEIFFNLQTIDVPSARILMFNANEGKVYVRTFLQNYGQSPGIWLDNLEHRFTFNVELIKH